jgi:hypothetical protein
VVLKEEVVFTHNFLTHKATDTPLKKTPAVQVPRTFEESKTQAIGSAIIPIHSYTNKDSDTDYVKEFLDEMLDSKNVTKPGSKEVDEDNVVYPFCTDGNKDSVFHSPDASYRMRKDGKETWVSVPVAESHLRHGCSHCNLHSYVDDIVYWVRPSVHFCETCMKTKIAQEYVRREGPAVKSELYDFSLAFKGA